MFCEEILTKDIPSLKTNISGAQAQTLMDELKIRHLPVVEEGKYLFLLSEKDLFNMDNLKSTIQELSVYAPYVSRKTSILDVLRIMKKDRLTYLPVINESGEFEGGVTLATLTEGLNEICNAGSDGALIAIETNLQECILSQIVHLIESNNAHVLTILSYFIKETGKHILLIKIDLEDAGPVLRSLERFNYPVKYYSQKHILTDETMRNRLDELMYYLEM